MNGPIPLGSWPLPTQFGEEYYYASVSQATSANFKNRTTVLLVQHPAPWCPWSSWSTLIYLAPQFPECGYTKWTKLDHGGPGVDQGHWQDHGARWWARSVQDHRGPLKNIFLMYIYSNPTNSSRDSHQQKFRLHHMRQPCIMTQVTSDLHPERPEHPDARYAPWLNLVFGHHPPSLPQHPDRFNNTTPHWDALPPNLLLNLPSGRA